MQQQIELTKLPLQLLNEQKQQMEQDINFLQESLNTLKMAQGKFDDSKKNVEKIMKLSSSPEKNSILVPLTESMFVKGCIDDPDKFLINLGTGFFINTDGEQAVKYFKRRHEYLNEQVDMVKKFIKEKSKARNMVLAVMQDKIQEQIESQDLKENEDEEGDNDD